MYSIVNLMTTVKDFCYINPSTLTGAIDVIVVEQPDGSFTCSPFHVRFGKIGVLRSKEKIVDVEINDKPVDFHMRLGDSGEAYFVEKVTGDEIVDVPRHLVCSPINENVDVGRPIGDEVQGFSADNVQKKDRPSQSDDAENSEHDTQQPKIFHAETSEVQVTKKVSSCGSDFRPIEVEAQVISGRNKVETGLKPVIVPSSLRPQNEEKMIDLQPDPNSEIKGPLKVRRKRSQMKKKKDLPNKTVDESVAMKGSGANSGAMSSGKKGKHQDKSGAMKGSGANSGAVSSGKKGKHQDESGAVKRSGTNSGALSSEKKGQKLSVGNAATGVHVVTIPQASSAHTTVAVESSVSNLVSKTEETEKRKVIVSSNTSLELAGLDSVKDPDYHFFSESEVAAHVTESIELRSTAIQSDSEVEKLATSDEDQRSPSWRWGELPSPVPKVGGDNNQVATADPAKPDARRSMLSSMFAFMQHNRKNQPNNSFKEQSTGPKDMYLADLTAEDVDPEVASLYFPRSHYRDFSVAYDAESESALASDGEGTSSDEMSAISDDVVLSEDAVMKDGTPTSHELVATDALMSNLTAITDEVVIPGKVTASDRGLKVALVGKLDITQDEHHNTTDKGDKEVHDTKDAIDKEPVKGQAIPEAIANNDNGNRDKEEDVESGCGASVPGSPEAVTELKSGTESLENQPRRKSESDYPGCVADDFAVDLEMSLCGGLGDGGPSKEAFEEHRITFADFQNNLKVVDDPSLVVRCLGKYYSWKEAAPLVVAAAFYKRHCTQSTIDIIMAGQVPKVKESNTYSSWWLWRKSDPKKSAPASLATLGTEDPSAAPDPPPPAVPQSPPPNSEKVAYIKTLRLTSEQISRLGLMPGQNSAMFSVTSAYQGTTVCKCHVYRWRHDDRVVISDIDGTITKSDVLGHLMPMLGRDWAQSGVAQLFTKIHKNGYKLLYVSARAIGQARTTRSYLKSIKQEDLSLPEGPLLLSPTGLLNALHREVIDRKPEDFKIPCLKDILALFPADCNPFYAGFGNRVNDVWTYRAVGIPMFRIFTVNHRGELTHESSKTFKTTYYNLSEIGDHMFPPFKRAKMCEDYSNFVYWRDPIGEVVIDPVTKAVNLVTRAITGSTVTKAICSSPVAKAITYRPISNVDLFD